MPQALMCRLVVFEVSRNAFAPADYPWLRRCQACPALLGTAGAHRLLARNATGYFKVAGYGEGTAC